MIYGALYSFGFSIIFIALALYISILNSSWMFSLIINVPTFLYGVLISQRKFLSGMIAAINVYLFYVLIYAIIKAIMQSSGLPWIGIAILPIAIIILDLFLFYIYNKLQNEIEEWFPTGLKWMFLLAVFSFLGVFIINGVITDLSVFSNLIFKLIYIFIFALFYIILNRFIFGYKKKIIELHDEKLFLSKYQSIMLQLASIDENEKNIAVLWHDLRHYVTSISMLLNDEKIEEAKILLKKLDSDIHSNKRELYTDSTLINAVISGYKDLSNKENIDFKVNIQSKLKNVVDETEIVIFLCNCLENAYNACLKVQEDKRYISFVARENNGSTVLCVKNSYDGSENAKENKKLDVSKSHGIGKHSVERFANKNGIILDYKITNLEFCITAYFPAVVQ
jgi:hypothetical protein